MCPSICNSFPVIRTASAKNRCFHVQQPTFLFPLEMPLRLSRNMLHRWKDNSMLVKHLAACTYLSSIVSELYDVSIIQCVSPKNRYFYHIFVSPGDAPRAITQNIIWMEREFDAYKLPRCMCLSNYNRFSDRAILVENRHFLIPPLHSTPSLRGFQTFRRNIATPFGVEKLE